MDTHPDRLAQTHSSQHATYLLDGVEGAHPLGPTVGQPVGDLAAAHQPLAASEVTVFTQHPAGPSKCHRHRETEKERQTDRRRRHNCQNILSLLFSPAGTPLPGVRVPRGERESGK